jgi:hypothetical protein
MNLNFDLTELPPLAEAIEVVQEVPNFPAQFNQVPAVTSPLDLSPVKVGLFVYEPNIKAMEADAAALVVADDASMAKAVKIAGRAKKGFNALEKKRKEALEPAAEFTKSVNSLFKSYQGRFAIVESTLKDKINAHNAKVALERRKAEEAARQAAAAAQAKLDAEIKAENERRQAEAEAENARRQAEAKANGQEAVKVEAVKIEAITIPVPVTPEPAKAVHTETGSLSFRKSWAFTVTDPAQVPREYLVVDEPLIRAAVKRGERNIPGVNIYEDSKPVIRA